MKKLIISALFLVLFAGGPAYAYYDFSFELTSSDNLTWELYFNSGETGDSTNGGSLLNFYFMDFEYDTSELAYSTYTPNYTIYGSLSPLGTIAVDTEAGTISNVSGQSLGVGNGYHSTPNETVLLGTFTFSQVSSVSDGTPDLDFWLEASTFGIRVDEELFSSSDTVGYVDLEWVTSEEGHVIVSPVPIPGAALLMLSGLLGMVGLRRRKS